MSRNLAEEWRQRIFVGQQDALMRYGHLTRDEVVALGRKGRLSRPVVEYLVAALAARPPLT